MAIVITKRQKEGIAKAMYPLVEVSPTSIANMPDEPEDGSSLGKIGEVFAKAQNEEKRSTGIEWTQHTWNPFVGCSVHTAGCTNCYAMKQAAVIEAPHYQGTLKFVKGNSVWSGVLNQSPPHILNKPRKIKGSAMIFVNSMSDFFHADAQYSWQLAAMLVMKECPQHIFQILTKRPENIENFVQLFGEKFPDNVWVGITMEREDYRFRIDILRQVPAKIRFMSVEPLIGPPGEMDLTDIHWVIGGGESGGNARVCKLEWVRSLRDQSLKQQVPFFWKQWGKPEFNPLYINGGTKYVNVADPIGKGGCMIDGVEYKQFPKM